jgi:hypothetical protein
LRNCDELGLHTKMLTRVRFRQVFQPLREVHFREVPAHQQRNRGTGNAAGDPAQPKNELYLRVGRAELSHELKRVVDAMLPFPTQQAVGDQQRQCDHSRCKQQNDANSQK